MAKIKRNRTTRKPRLRKGAQCYLLEIGVRDGKLIAEFSDEKFSTVDEAFQHVVESLERLFWIAGCCGGEPHVEIERNCAAERTTMICRSTDVVELVTYDLHHDVLMASAWATKESPRIVYPIPNPVSGLRSA